MLIGERIKSIWLTKKGGVRKQASTDIKLREPDRVYIKTDKGTYQLYLSGFFPADIPENALPNGPGCSLEGRSPSWCERIVEVRTDDGERLVILLENGVILTLSIEYTSLPPYGDGIDNSYLCVWLVTGDELERIRGSLPEMQLIEAPDRK
jgi:hypothetical protein